MGKAAKKIDGNPNLHLTTQERVKVQEAVKMMDLPDHVHSLDVLLSEWKQFSLDVERGYAYTLDDYDNDLSVHELIQRILERLPVATKGKIQLRKDPWDEKFISNTVAVRPQHETFLFNGEYRVPVKCVGELREDLLKEGILKS